MSNVRDRFEREAEIVRSLGGSVTTGDLRAYGEERAYEAMSSADEERAAMDAIWLDEIRGELVWLWAVRHEDPQYRETIRSYVKRLKEARP